MLAAITKAEKIVACTGIPSGSPRLANVGLIDLSQESEHPTTHYVWRTQGDGKVRPSHAVNDGKIFAWDDPPPTGHPGEDYGCWCVAEAYYPKITERLSHQMVIPSNTGPRWENHDFIWHFYTGEGAAVTLPQIGHLDEIVHHWAYRLDRLQEWNKQIIEKARTVRNGNFDRLFGRAYSFEAVEFSHGDGVVKGKFVGDVTEASGILILNGETKYQFSDRFTDPLDIREFVAWLRERPNRLKRLFQLIGNSSGLRNGPLIPETDITDADMTRQFIRLTDLKGTAFDITGTWTSKLSAEVYLDEENSRFKRLWFY